MSAEVALTVPSSVVSNRHYREVFIVSNMFTHSGFDRSF
jgi:ABC-type uncharacterized transport system permease subunit